MDLGILLIPVVLQTYQKEAILRQMHEYKREKNTLESQLKDVKTRAANHDNHLRIVDAWWSQVWHSSFFNKIIADMIQLLDEVRLLAEDEIPEHNDDSELPTPPVTLHADTN